jgi:hypothetical protein
MLFFSMQSYKAPGPDGFQPLFFKHFWNVVGNDVWCLVRDAFNKVYIDEHIA